MRVLKEDGTGWLIIDDAICEGEYVGVPDRLVAQLKEEGYKIIHNGPWVKEGTKPDPAQNRYPHKHERIIGIANSNTYHFDRQQATEQTDVIEEPTSSLSDHSLPDDTDIKHDAMYSVELVEHILRVATPNKICSACKTPYTPEYEVTDILNLKNKDTRYQAKRAIELFHETPEFTREHARACRANGLSDTGQGKRTQNGSGNNSEKIKELLEEADESDFPNSYQREFTAARKEKVDTTQQCDCEQNNTDQPLVLDPFVGSGTTCVAAVKHDCNYTGIDIKEEYIELAQTRLTDGVNKDLSTFL
jgi:hypothetical protein